MSSDSAGPLLVVNAELDGEPVGLRCHDGEIAEIGPEVTAAPGEESLDAGGAMLTPPLVNGHTHAAMTLFRGSGGNLPLMPWLQERVWPVEAKLAAEDVYWGARLACVEMIRSGTTRFWDMYWQPEATAQAVIDSGMRATIGAPLFDVDGNRESLQQSALQSIEALSDLDHPRIEPALAPHAIYTVSEDSLRWIAELASERNLPLHIHLAETEQEVSDCEEAHGVPTAPYLDSVGMLGERTLLAHCVWLEQDEIELLAARGATAVASPVSNMKLAVGGALPYRALREAGVPLGIGTDGAGSNDSLDLLADLKTFALLQRHATGDATVVDSEDAWRIATGQRAPLLLNREPLSVGAPADFLLLRRDAPELSFGSPADCLVYAASGSAVETTVVAGRVLMHDGTVPGADEVVARAVERSRRLGIMS